LVEVRFSIRSPSFPVTVTLPAATGLIAPEVWGRPEGHLASIFAAGASFRGQLDFRLSFCRFRGGLELIRIFMVCLCWGDLEN